jgi:hypothetical protein
VEKTCLAGAFVHVAPYYLQLLQGSVVLVDFLPPQKKGSWSGFVGH